MTEAVAGPATAGALLRAARERQGLHIAALAASIKVTPRKLEALEADRYDELPDLAFTRALAQSVCRALKIDAEPVLALLPKPAGVGRLEQVASGLKTPFHERPGRESEGGASLLGRPAVWAPLLVLLAALVLYLLPTSVFDPAPEPAPVAVTPPPAADVASATAPAAPVVETVHSAPAEDDGASEPARDAAPAAALLTLRASEPSWVEVRDAQGAVLLSRTLQAGETVGVDGALPLRATIGNALGVSAAFRGEPLDLAPRTRDNIARLELN
ncbi:MAG: helix-turn-helix domain-containing protein [Burkholderiaceae bacterium]|jgi:cytoskeleton protein RodZ|nr:helix-turn-helix domain-containing protein [Burkholderiaceae bacterium]